MWKLTKLLIKTLLLVILSSWITVADGQTILKKDEITVSEDLQGQINQLKNLYLKIDIEFKSLKILFEREVTERRNLKKLCLSEKTANLNLKTKIECFTKKLLAIELKLKPQVEIWSNFTRDSDSLAVNHESSSRPKRDIYRGRADANYESRKPGAKTLKKWRNAVELGGKFEGDMVLPSPERQSSGLVNPTTLWPEGRVIYKLDNNFTDSERKMILNAMWEITEKTCIEFKERQSTDEKEFVNIIRGANGSGCWADVGYRGKPQELNLQFNSCIYHGIIIHELMHTLGFFHEQARTDRDEYIQINVENIDILQRHNFKSYNSNFLTDYGLPYDYRSIMHYEENSFAINPEEPTVIVKDPSAYIGNRQSLSQLDVKRIQRRYNTSDFKCRCTSPNGTCTKDRLLTESYLVRLFKLEEMQIKNRKTEIDLFNINQAVEKLKSFHRGYPKSCNEIDEFFKSQRKHQIYPYGGDKKGVEVLCDFETDGGGWTFIQKRNSGPTEEFYRGWTEYEKGFGRVDGNFWIGLKAIHALTKDRDQELRIDLWDFEGDHAYAKYSNFSISDSSDCYRLSIGGYSGTAGDSITVYDGNWYLNGMKFSTHDRDNDLADFNCAEKYKGAWWYKSCYSSNLNGLYFERGDLNDTGMSWYFWKNSWNSLRQAEMKIRKRR